MELTENKVWIVSGNGCFAVLSSYEWAEKYKNAVIAKWLESIKMEKVPKRLNSRAEIEMHADEYPEIIQVDDFHYELIMGLSSNRTGEDSQYWRYQLLSETDWENYYQNYVSQYVIEEHPILK